MKKILILLAVLAVVAVAAYKFLYKQHRDISSEESQYSVTVSALSDEFTKNESAANQKYADKTLLVSGRVTSVDTEAKTVTLDEKLSASFSRDMDIATGDQVRLKGRFVGYDDLLEELKMDQVTINN